MGTLYSYIGFEMDISGVKTARGSRGGPTSITVDGQTKVWNRSLADSTTATIWDGTDTSEPLSNFDYLYIIATQAIRIELTCDKGAEVGTVVFCKNLPANTPWCILYDDAMANYTANYASGTADVIDRIRVRNVSGSTAVVDAVLVT